jgi:hypothetical protein
MLVVVLVGGCNHYGIVPESVPPRNPDIEAMVC